MVQVAADKATGHLVALNTTNVDFAAAPYYGLWFPCSGSVLPNDVHLGSEEFEPDCRYNEDTNNGDRSRGIGLFGTVAQAAQWSYYQDIWPIVNAINFSPGLNLASPPVAGVIDVVPNGGNNPPTITWPPGAEAKFHCYAYGWTPEASPVPKLAAVGGPAAKVTKWYTLGRLSHEVSVMLYNNKVVLEGDDEVAGIMAMFEADVPGDLSSGTLYAAKVSNQVDGAANGQGAEWDVAWVRLGHGKQGALKSMVETIQFTDMFETSAVQGTGLAAFCLPGFTLVVTYGSGSTLYQAAGGRFLECLKIKDGMQDTAAFFETRRTAAVLGATTEFEKASGDVRDRGLIFFFVFAVLVTAVFSNPLPPFSSFSHSSKASPTTPKQKRRTPPWPASGARPRPARRSRLSLRLTWSASTTFACRPTGVAACWSWTWTRSRGGRTRCGWCWPARRCGRPRAAAAAARWTRWPGPTTCT